MTDGTIPPELHEKYLKIILFETERLTDLTHDLLTLNEFDTNHLLLNREVFDIHEMIKHVAASFEGVCTQKKISIELIFATKHLNVNADKRKIQQVLYNLLDNAIKFSDPDSIITIENKQTAVKKSIYSSQKINGDRNFQERHSEKNLGTFLQKVISPAGRIRKAPVLDLRS